MKFALVDGKCPVCDTQVETEHNGVRVRFMPHDDPDWCRSAAMYNAKMLRRVIEQAQEESAITKYREGFYRHAYAIAIRFLCGAGDERLAPGSHSEDPEIWRARVEHDVRKDDALRKERDTIVAMKMARGDFGYGPWRMP